MRARRGWLGWLVVGAALSSALSGPAAWTQPALTRVTLGHSNYRNDVAALWVPNEIGIFRKHGLDATVTLVEGGRQMTQALLSGSVPIGMTGVPTVATSTAAGGDAVLILGLTNKATFDIWAKPEIKTPGDLRGKIFGISGLGATSHLAAFIVLRHFGLDPAKDRISFLAVGDEGLRAQALLTQRVDVTLLDPSVSGPVKEKGFTLLGNMETLGVPFINNAMVTTRTYLKEQPHVVEAVVKSVVEGNAYILNPANRPTVTRILATKMRLDADQADTAYRDLLPKVERKPYLSLEAVAATLQILGAREPKVAELKPEQLVDLSILRRLDRDGFIEQLAR
jgi:NitT/TauT family transport system substrate-binding protein